jgi:hypothetical protein
MPTVGPEGDRAVDLDISFRELFLDCGPLGPQRLKLDVRVIAPLNRRIKLLKAPKVLLVLLLAARTQDFGAKDQGRFAAPMATEPTEEVGTRMDVAFRIAGGDHEREGFDCLQELVRNVRRAVVATFHNI